MGDLSHEPSMEEILSSIKRIIAEDSDAALSGSRGKRAVGRAAVDSVQPATADDNDVLELTVAAPEPVAETAMIPDPHPEPALPKTTAEAAPADRGESPIVSEAALSASRSSIAALSALIVKPQVHGGDTLEGLVREMLTPMLAAWLDERLPDVVERLVAQEIKRITERGA